MTSAPHQLETNLVDHLRTQGKTFWLATLGLAMESCAGQFGRLTPSTFYPMGAVTANLTPLFSIAVALVVFMVSRKRLSLFASRALEITIATLFSLTLAAYYLGTTLPQCPEWLVSACYLTSSAMGIAYLFVWYEKILSVGQTSALLVVGVGLMFRALLQCITLFLIPEIGTTLLTLMPLLSLPCLFAVDAHLRSSKAEGDSHSDASSNFFSGTWLPSRIVLLSLIGLVFLVSVMNGLSNPSNTEALVVARHSVEYRILLIGANIFAGLLLAFVARLRVGLPALYLFVILTVALSCISVFSNSSLNGGAQAVYALSSQISLRLTDFILVLIAFLFAREGRAANFPLYALGRAAISAASWVGLLVLMASSLTGSELVSVVQSLIFAGLFVSMMVFFLNIDHSSVSIMPEVTEQNGSAQTESSSENATDEFTVALEALAKKVRLTPTEINVLRLIARGKNAESASKDLVVSVNTIRTHIRNIYAKTGVHSQQELIALIEEHITSAAE